MPRYAHTTDDEPVHVFVAAPDDNRSYYCPCCDRELYIAGGQGTQVVKHFRHLPKESCHRYGSGGETYRHVLGKSEVEYWLSESDQATDVAVETDTGTVRPDIAATIGADRVAFEIQSSSLTGKGLRERTKERSAEGLHTCWIFDAGGRYRAQHTSSKGNTYMLLHAGEQAYLSLANQPDTPYIHYFALDSRTPLFAQRYRMFDDRNGGWPTHQRPLSQVELYRGQNGYRLAAIPEAVPADTGDDRQMRLFEA